MRRATAAQEGLHLQLSSGCCASGPNHWRFAGLGVPRFEWLWFGLNWATGCGRAGSRPSATYFYSMRSTVSTIACVCVSTSMFTCQWGGWQGVVQWSQGCGLQAALGTAINGLKEHRIAALPTGPAPRQHALHPAAMAPSSLASSPSPLMPATVTLHPGVNKGMAWHGMALGTCSLPAGMAGPWQAS